MCVRVFWEESSLCAAAILATACDAAGERGEMCLTYPQHTLPGSRNSRIRLMTAEWDCSSRAILTPASLLSSCIQLRKCSHLPVDRRHLTCNHCMTCEFVKWLFSVLPFCLFTVSPLCVCFVWQWLKREVTAVCLTCLNGRIPVGQRQTKQVTPKPGCRTTDKSPF